MLGLTPRRLVAALAAVVAAGTLTTTTSSPAQAEAWTHTDPTGDVTSVVYREESDHLFYSPAPEREAADIRSMRAAHNSTRLAIQFSMRDSFSEYRIGYRILTPSAEYYLERARFNGRSSVAFYKEVAGYGLKRVACSGVAWNIDWTTAKVAVSLPRACLGHPRFVRVGVTASERDVVPPEEAGDDPDWQQWFSRTWVDDALRTGYTGARLGVSPRIHRG